MSIARKAAKSGIWFAGFKFLTQLLSWAVTIAIARILSPEDYGLMALASVLTGYIEIFSELGLGAAIVQREGITQQECSSNFWFSVTIGTLFAGVAFTLAYPTAWLFNEPRVIPITQTISILFVIGALMVVPFNLLMRNLRFKAIGAIQLCAVAVSSGSMLWMAYAGFGVWTLIGGTLLLRLVTVALVFAVSGWRPDFHFRWSEVRGCLRFGISVAGGRSLFYLFQKSDVFVIGKLLGTQSVGYYSFGMQLASMPTDKIVSVVNQVSFPVFSRFQHDVAEIQHLYLRATKYLAVIVSPLYLAGTLWGDEIIRAVLGETWVPVILLFRAFCFSQLVVSITVINGAVHTSMGRSHWVMYFYLVSLALMPGALYVSAQHGLAATAVPWVTIYPLICVGWTLVTLKKLNISAARYLRNSAVHLAVALLVVGLVKMVSLGFLPSVGAMNYRAMFLQDIVLGAALYTVYLCVWERKLLRDIWEIRNA